MMEITKRAMCLDICKCLDGPNVVDICEAVPTAKCILKSKTIRDVLYKYVSKMQWVNATVYRWLYTALSMPEEEMESEEKIELQSTQLYKAIRYYQEDCRSRSYCKNAVWPGGDKIFHFLVIESQLKDLDIRTYFLNTIVAWGLVHGKHPKKTTSKYGNFPQIVKRVSNFDIHFDVSTLQNEVSQYRASLDISSIRQFDAVVYAINSTQQCQNCQSLPDELRTLMANISSIASKKSFHYPLLLILDFDAPQKGQSTFNYGRSNILVSNLLQLNEAAFKCSSQDSVSVEQYKWWRVWHLTLRNKYYRNMYEAFQWVALQVTAINNEKIDQN
ncbi:unnamed protein product [Hydatigera taeniaeformis]|uniref:DUF4485 domain-containing protein n=1 Tax=Hydatigena taeniaeformis TaxID=6205 RepID=A0A0R3X914_HYDTA|nr:unnamed protein product [Hydatigera taeniaeformis]